MPGITTLSGALEGGTVVWLQYMRPSGPLYMAVVTHGLTPTWPGLLAEICGREAALF